MFYLLGFEVELDAVLDSFPFGLQRGNDQTSADEMGRITHTFTRPETTRRRREVSLLVSGRDENIVL